MGLSDYEEDVEQDGLDGYESFDKKKVFKVMRAIANLKVTYVSELVGYTGLDRDGLSRILHKLQDEGFLEQLHPSLKNSDPRLLSRVQHFNARGMTGLEQFRQANWYALNSEREWFLHVEGSDNQFVDEYHNRVSSEEYENQSSNELFDLVKDRMELR